MYYMSVQHRTSMNHALAKRDEMHLGDALYQASNSCDYGSVKSIYPYPK